ncbi:phosphotransferase [Actinopolymorpha pittospori]|uniref:Ser/Thr protein kinase RdoA (MazF antagonist) n=1 Tax=Actinopolymorpha pittospori TaxID=648752 RepID=A0A927MYK8_9ACTN|nr:phosphotransferase [Actinopolymorpha pittospori]MBE1608587.1 Ser/Thr protein kinase RdoA (MazF antagonist) [Actinopolymorpha pittospori]
MRDWNELKSAVKKRAANAPTAPEGLAEDLSGVYDLGRVTEAPSPVSYTPGGRSWSIKTDRGRWLAVTVWDWVSEEQAELGARLCDAAVAAGVAAPVPVRSRQGRLIETVQEQAWRVQEWIKVGPSPMVPIAANVARRAGAILGTLHSLAIPSEAPVHPHLTSRRPEASWHALLDEARAAHKPWADQLQEALPTLDELSTIEVTIGDELILCHRSLNPEAVRMGHNDELVATGWDLAGSLTPELELGCALRDWTLHPSTNQQAITSFRDGYVEAAGQWPKLELASFAVAVTGYLNWTYDRICAAISSADSDHATFSESEAADLLNRPMTRSSLQQLLAAADA